MNIERRRAERLALSMVFQRMKTVTLAGGGFHFILIEIVRPRICSVIWMNHITHHLLSEESANRPALIRRPPFGWPRERLILFYLVLYSLSMLQQGNMLIGKLERQNSYAKPA